AANGCSWPLSLTASTSTRVLAPSVSAGAPGKRWQLALAGRSASATQLALLPSTRQRSSAAQPPSETQASSGTQTAVARWHSSSGSQSFSERQTKDRQVPNASASDSRRQTAPPPQSMSRPQ